MRPPEGVYPPPPKSRVYCNRNLRLDQIEVVGFDMDYTLAIYRQDAIDRLSIEYTAKKLVERGYPPRLLAMDYRSDFPIRGLLVDRRLGNILKMDRYRYVKRAYHGMRELRPDERRRIYHARRIRPGTSRYYWVDTLYGLSEVAVYAAAIDSLEENGDEIDYDALFKDVRECIDEAHRDGSITERVLADLPAYVERDPDLGIALHKLRSAGKKLFLLTNSHAPFTDKMMSYLLDGALAEYPSWKKYFDIVITAAKKPGFFTGRKRFDEVVGDELRPARRLERGRIYAGGNIQSFRKHLGVDGDRVLYVGDHIYGDVLSTKKETVWRTAMIVQEMEGELDANDAMVEELERLDGMAELRLQVVDALREHQVRLKLVEGQLAAGEEPHAELEATRVRHRHAIDRLKKRLRRYEEEQEALEAEIEEHFHPFWGSLFKAGPEVSSFGDQVEDFACLYTTRASNFLYYSPMHYFQSPRDRMPHEL